MAVFLLLMSFVTVAPEIIEMSGSQSTACDIWFDRLPCSVLIVAPLILSSNPGASAARLWSFSPDLLHISICSPCRRSSASFRMSTRLCPPGFRRYFSQHHHQWLFSASHFSAGARRLPTSLLSERSEYAEQSRGPSQTPMVAVSCAFRCGSSCWRVHISC